MTWPAGVWRLLKLSPEVDDAASATRTRHAWSAQSRRRQPWRCRYGLAVLGGGEARGMDSGHALVVLRHAKAAGDPGVNDVQRPLTGRGRRDAAAAGRWLLA